jgi:hypothetical protein
MSSAPVAGGSGAPAGEPSVLMIAGAGRSGSTLLERILATAPGVVAVGELTELWRRGLVEDERCGCGERFAACPFWTEVGRRAFGGWEHADPERMVALERRINPAGLPLAGLPAIGRSRREALDEYGSALERIYSAVAEANGAKLIVDSSKWPRHLYVVRRLAVRLRVVQLVRDPRGVVFSWTRPEQRPHGGEARMHTYRPTASALRWVAFNLFVDLSSALGTPTERVAYERMIADPGSIADELLAPAGVEPAPSLQAPQADGIELELGHGIAGNPVRFERGRIALRPDRRWREQMPAHQRLLATAICGPLYGLYRASGLAGS